jgi:hypothetical protein
VSRFHHGGTATAIPVRRTGLLVAGVVRNDFVGEIPRPGEARRDRMWGQMRAMANLLIHLLSGTNAGRRRMAVALVAVLVAVVLASFGGASWHS